jgi:hypothetical protein
MTVFCPEIRPFAFKRFLLVIAYIPVSMTIPLVVVLVLRPMTHDPVDPAPASR